MRRLALVLAALLLAACMGVLALRAEPATAASGGYVARCGGGKIFLNAKEKRSFQLHNRVRRERGLRPFCVHPALQRAARAHSKDMIRRDYFAHGSVGARLKRYGYDWRLYGENIAGGSGSYGSPGVIFNRWMKSPSHRKNILDRRFREIGVGTYTGVYRGYRNYTMYTADFGRR
jgi:uncharacterized protein YkwD